MRLRRLFVDGRIAADAPPIVFLHIQKTAGSSFSWHLRSHFTPAQIAPDYWGDERTLQENGDKRLIAGHITFAQATRHFPTAFLVTMLRHPVARVQSQYRSFHDESRRARDWRLHIALERQRDVDFATKASFDEFILSDRPTIRGHIDNLQTYFLADRGLRGRPAVEAAIRNLHTRIGFFGIQEHFDRSIGLLHLLTGSHRRSSVPESERNVSLAADLELSKRGRERLAECTALDAELYAAAQRSFWRTYLPWRLVPTPIRRRLG